MDYSKIDACVTTVDVDIKNIDIEKIKIMNNELMNIISQMSYDGEPQPLFNDKIASIDTIIK